MTGVVRFLAATLFSVLFVACGGQTAIKPAAPPPPQVQPRTRATPVKAREEAPKLIAPPPAYGNRVVMAQGPKGSTAL